MPVYAYKGYNLAGKVVTGTQDAENPRVIKAQLKRDGIFLTELAESASTKKSASRNIDFKFLAQRVSSQELATATRQLATLVGAGIPLVDSLIALIDQVQHPGFKSVWADVKQRVNE